MNYYLMGEFDPAMWTNICYKVNVDFIPYTGKAAAAWARSTSAAGIVPPGGDPGAAQAVYTCIFGLDEMPEMVDVRCLLKGDKAMLFSTKEGKRCFTLISVEEED